MSPPLLAWNGPTKDDITTVGVKPHDFIQLNAMSIEYMRSVEMILCGLKHNVGCGRTEGDE